MSSTKWGLAKDQGLTLGDPNYSKSLCEQVTLDSPVDVPYLVGMSKTQCTFRGNDTGGAQCHRDAQKGWTTCGRHHSAGHSVKQQKGR